MSGDNNNVGDEEKKDPAKDALNERINQDSGGGGSSLGKVETPEERKAKDEDGYREMAQEVGFKNMPLDSLPSKGMFYPKHMKVMFRSASVEEIKHYSSMNEQDLLDVDAKIHTILKSCMKITGVKENGAGSYKDLSETDKIYMLFAVRDLTMLKHGREHKLMQTLVCEDCGTQNKFELENNVFGYYDIKENLMKFYDEEQRALIITHPKLSEAVRINIPSMGVMQWMAEYIKKKEEDKRMGNTVFYDKQYLTFLQFLCKDWRDLDDDYIKKEYPKYKSWTLDKHDVMNYVADNLNFSIKPSVEIVCTNCDHKNRVMIKFRRGYKSIFDISGVAEELFSDGGETPAP